jgi:hypothetical protein
LHERIKDNDKPSGTPTKKKSTSNNSNIGFSASPIKFSDRAKKGGHYRD